MSKLAKMLATQRLTAEEKRIVTEIGKSFVDQEQNRYVKKKSFAPSSLGYNEGKCPRAWYLKFNGVDSEDVLTFKGRSNMETGTNRHELLQEYLAANPNLDIDIEVELTAEDPPIRAFADGIMHMKDGSDGVIPLEIKTSGDQAFAYRVTSFKAANYHKLQLLIYCWIKDARMGVLLYENRNDFEHTKIPVFVEDHQEYLDYLLDWLRTVYKAYTDDTVPNFFEGKRKNSKICKDCPFYKPCHELGEKENGVDIKLLELPE